ncbi:MAG: hypothetical protein FJ004_02445 [Chloroflexi bacterium]|nr:hypothetical protein [Chloroflexota bacterium]
MQWEFVVALVVAIPIILLPVALVWYSLNMSGLYKVIKDRRRLRKRLAIYGKEIRIAPPGQFDTTSDTAANKR